MDQDLRFDAGAPDDSISHYYTLNTSFQFRFKILISNKLRWQSIENGIGMLHGLWGEPLTGHIILVVTGEKTNQRR